MLRVRDLIWCYSEPICLKCTNMKSPGAMLLLLPVLGPEADYQNKDRKERAIRELGCHLTQPCPVGGGRWLLLVLLLIVSSPQSHAHDNRLSFCAFCLGVSLAYVRRFASERLGLALAGGVRRFSGNWPGNTIPGPINRHGDQCG